MRGIPVVGRGSSSTMYGTDPLQALIAKENREEARRRKDAILLRRALERQREQESR